MPRGVLDREEIVDSLAEVAALLAAWLPDREPTVLVVVGGSYMALRGLRQTTADVDTVTRLQVTVRDAVNVVARRRHLRPNKCRVRRRSAGSRRPDDAARRTTPTLKPLVGSCVVPARRATPLTRREHHQRHLTRHQLNDYAEPFTPIGLRLDMCDVLLDLPALRVLGPPADCIFLMKLYAGRAPDFDDMVTLWPRCTFASASEAAERFVAAYPQAPPDPDLIPYIAATAATAAAAAP